jgi:hypothetical protein
MSKGYLRFAPGLTSSAPARASTAAASTGTACYRVMGTSLVRVNADGTVTTIGTIAAGGRRRWTTVRLPVIVGDGKAWLYDGTTLTQITDVDLGTPIDVIWIDGYYMFTDGSYLIVTELNNPFSIDPLKYGSSEADPDRIKGRAEAAQRGVRAQPLHHRGVRQHRRHGLPVHARARRHDREGLRRHRAKTLFADTFAWVGSGRNEPVQRLHRSAARRRRSPRARSRSAWQAYTEAQLSTIEVEAKADRMHQHLLVHLPNETLVYDMNGSGCGRAGLVLPVHRGRRVRQRLPRAQLRLVLRQVARAATRRTAASATWTRRVVTQYGEIAGWQFDTMMLYNAGKGAIVWSLELVGTTGRAPAATTRPSSTATRWTA